MNLTITDKAVKEIKHIIAEQNLSPSNNKLYLRLRVLGGGCAGFSNKLDLDEVVNEKLDNTFVINNVDVVVDKRSALYLEGATVDFHDGVDKRGFVVTNPNAKNTCGCGSSFSM